MNIYEVKLRQTDESVGDVWATQTGVAATAMRAAQIVLAAELALMKFAASELEVHSVRMIASCDFQELRIPKVGGGETEA